MAKKTVTPTVDHNTLSQEEIDVILKMREGVPVAEAVASTPAVSTVGIPELAAALTTAINAAKPPEKKNPFNRKINTPWTPKDGSPKLKLRRNMYQHGIPIDPDYITNEEIALLNKLRPGRYLDQFVNVVRRKDRGVNIDYPVKTAAQRMRLVHQFGIRNLAELLSKCLEEAANRKAIIDQPDDFD